MSGLSVRNERARPASMRWRERETNIKVVKSTWNGYVRMASITSLPRHVVIDILKKCDMSARIKLGLIFRLQVPDHVRDALSAISKPQTCSWSNSRWFVRLGRRLWYAMYTMYREIHSHHVLSTVEHWRGIDDEHESYIRHTYVDVGRRSLEKRDDRGAYFKV